MAQAQDIHLTTEDQAALNEVMQLLEASPDTTAPTGIVNLGFTPDANDIPAKREEAGHPCFDWQVQRGHRRAAHTHKQVKRLTDKEVEKYSKRQKAYIGSKTTESLIDSFFLLASKGLSLVVKVDDVEKLQQELKYDYIINQELSSLAGGLALRCGCWLALANAALITTKHIQLEREPNQPGLMAPHTTQPDLLAPTPTHPSKDGEGYSLEGFDEVG